MLTLKGFLTNPFDDKALDFLILFGFFYVGIGGAFRPRP